MTRRSITERQKIDALLYRHNILCAVCRERILPSDRIEWDHIVPVWCDGQNTPDNIRPIHYPCHRVKTSGTKATSAGSDVQRAAKVKRIRGETCNGPKKPWPKRVDPWGKERRK